MNLIIAIDDRVIEFTQWALRLLNEWLSISRWQILRFLLVITFIVWGVPECILKEWSLIFIDVVWLSWIAIISRRYEAFAALVLRHSWFNKVWRVLSLAVMLMAAMLAFGNVFGGLTLAFGVGMPAAFVYVFISGDQGKRGKRRHQQTERIREWLRSLDWLPSPTSDEVTA